LRLIPALVAQMRGRTTAGGFTFRSRIPIRYPIPTRAPAEIASIQSRTGMAQRMRMMKRMKKPDEGEGARVLERVRPWSSSGQGGHQGRRPGSIGLPGVFGSPPSSAAGFGADEPRAGTLRMQRCGWGCPASIHSESETTSTRSSPKSPVPEGRRSVTATPTTLQVSPANRRGVAGFPAGGLAQEDPQAGEAPVRGSRAPAPRS
jgi:hypothetical protein